MAVTNRDGSEFIEIIRKYNKPGSTATEGSLYAGDLYMHTIELPWLNNEKYRSCIPNGLYPCVLAWSNRYQKLMPRLLNVPNRDSILIHPGNFIGDSQGCIIVGNVAAPGVVYDSRNAFEKLYAWLGQALRVAPVYCHISWETGEIV